MLKIDQMVTGVISGMDEAYNGLLRCGKDVVLVRHVMKQEEVRVRIVRRIAKGYIGEIVEIKKASPYRIAVKCPIYERCGSCQLLHMNAKGQQEFKNRSIRTLCAKAKIGKLKAEEIVAMEEPWHYRNKMIIGFQRDKQRRIQAGFYEEFSHRIIPYKRCLLHPEVCDDIIAGIVELMGKLRIEPYDEDKRRGLIRHVVMRYGAVSGQIMIVLVLNSNVFPARKNFIQELRRRYPQITTIVQNVNTRKTSVVLGDEERVLYGPGYIEDVLCGMTFRISAKSFYQINHEQTEVLYQRSVELLKLNGGETVLDAYCGIGTIGMYVSRFVKQVIGVEINGDAVKDARINAKINQINNIRFVCDDAGRYMSRLAAEKKRLDVVIMDPPRSGSSEEFIKSLVRMKPSQVLYISCNPQTQIRDLQVFERMGYRVQGEMVPVDLFPHTVHVETVALLSKLNVDKHIDVEIKLDELDLTSAESKATYAQIKEYVLEKFGLKVSTLYIAQTKKKCGIEMREHYNKSKKDNQAILQCTPEKEEAIMDALRHFKMI